MCCQGAQESICSPAQSLDLPAVLCFPTPPGCGWERDGKRASFLGVAIVRSCALKGPRPGARPLSPRGSS